MRFDTVSCLLELVRWQGRGLRSSYSAGQGLKEICYTAADVGVPAEFVSSSLCVLDEVSRRIGASMDATMADFPDVYAYQREAEEANRRGLELVVQRLQAMNLAPQQVLLLGDAAVLLGLYGTLRAYRATTWVVGVPQYAGVGEQSVTERAVTAEPLDVQFGVLGRLEDRLDELARVMMLDGVEWRVPKTELLVVFLAARVGDPEASPDAPAWAHLAAALKGAKGQIDADEVLALAGELELAGRVHRGFAVVRILFPELRHVLPAAKLDVPAWERVALRLAANRLVQAVVGEEE